MAFKVPLAVDIHSGKEGRGLLWHFRVPCGFIYILGLCILISPGVKSWLIGKDPDAGKDWGQEEKRMTEDEVVGWHHWLNRHGFGCTLGVGDGQGGPACYSSWGCKESDMTEWLNWTDSNLVKNVIGILIGIALNLQTILGSMSILRILIFSIQEHRIFFHFFVSF